MVVLKRNESKQRIFNLNIKVGSWFWKLKFKLTYRTFFPVFTQIFGLKNDFSSQYGLRAFHRHKRHGRYIKPTIPNLSKWEKLSELRWNNFWNLKQSKDEYKKRLFLDFHLPLMVVQRRRLFAKKVVKDGSYTWLNSLQNEGRRREF